jgi:hypothetical protein
MDNEHKIENMTEDESREALEAQQRDKSISGFKNLSEVEISVLRELDSSYIFKGKKAEETTTFPLK